MTALALRMPAPSRLNWPRISALSGTLSLHIYVVLLLLTPPVAYQVMRQVEPDKVVVTLIEPPPKPVEIVEPVLPVPKHKEAPPPKPVPHHEAQTHVDVPVTNTDSTMSYPATPETGSADIGSPAQDVAPTALGYGTKTQVKYPRDALARREQGTVILRVLVGSDGLPQQVDIEKSSGSPRLDNAARDAVRHWTFRPGTRNGVAQSAWARVPVAFDLQQL